MTDHQVAEATPKYLTPQHSREGGNPVPAGYKQTEVGVIPEDWNIVQLSSVASKITDGTHDTPRPVRDGRPFLTAIHVKENRIDFDGCYFVSEEIHQEIYRRCNPEFGDILMVNIGAGTATTAVVNVSYEFSLKNVALIKTNKINDGFYINYALSFTKEKTLESISTGGAQPFLSLGQIAKLKIATPLRKEQTANALSDVDALISELEKLIAKKQAIKTATMQQLLTGRTRLPQFVLREDGSKKGYKQSELGEIPEDWEVVKMGDLAKIQRGASPRPIDSPVWFDRNSSVGWLRISDVSRTSKYLTETTQSLSKLGIANSRFVPQNNLVMSICETVGKPIITKKNLCIHDGFVVFNDLLIDQDYMYYILKELEDEWGKQGQTGSQMNLNTELINRSYVTTPKSKKEQTTIAKILSDMDEEIQALEQRLTKTRQIKQGMMQELLTGKTRLIKEKG